MLASVHSIDSPESIVVNGEVHVGLRFECAGAEEVRLRIKSRLYESTSYLATVNDFMW